jgi:hypothetical protein
VNSQTQAQAQAQAQSQSQAETQAPASTLNSHRLLKTVWEEIILGHIATFQNERIREYLRQTEVKTRTTESKEFYFNSNLGDEAVGGNNVANSEANDVAWHEARSPHC